MKRVFVVQPQSFFQTVSVPQGHISFEVRAEPYEIDSAGVVTQLTGSDVHVFIPFDARSREIELAIVQAVAAAHNVNTRDVVLFVQVS